MHFGYLYCHGKEGADPEVGKGYPCSGFTLLVSDDQAGAICRITYNGRPAGGGAAHAVEDHATASNNGSTE
jgi:hypothetical protein